LAVACEQRTALQRTAGLLLHAAFKNNAAHTNKKNIFFICNPTNLPGNRNARFEETKPVKGRRARWWT
jgi:hypothetical protein